MDIAFHYYVIKLLCLGLGMGERDADIVAYASQHVDDNTEWRKIDEGMPTEFPVVATFSIDISKKKDDTYPTLLIHFPPGDGPDVPGVGRDDGTWFEGITTPNAKMAEEALDAAFASKNLYQIGVALHSYADTWAHQGFAGCTHQCNAFPGSKGLYKVLPNLGHGQAGHYPDWPVTWEDQRLQGDFCNINNKNRFYGAAVAIANKLDAFINPKRKEEFKGEAVMEVVDRVFKAFGEPIPSYGRKDNEIEVLSLAQMNDFRNLGADKYFGGHPLCVYDDYEWQKAATYVEVMGLEDGWFSRLFSKIFSDPLPDKEYWQATFDAKQRTHLLDSDSTVKVKSKKRFFETFPEGKLSKKTPKIVQNITYSHYYNFHVAAQTHLAHLVHETELRMVEREDSEEFVSLYQYYDKDDEQEWVGEMKTRTLARRQSIYGDDN